MAKAEGDNPTTAKKPAPVKAKAKAEKGKRKRRHKPKDFPKRPLSAYNIFFKETREVIIKEAKEGDNVDFQTMAKEIATRWKALEPKERERVDRLASADMERYREAVKGTSQRSRQGKCLLSRAYVNKREWKK